MFNRTYQIRSRRFGLVSAGEVIQELVERAGDRKRFYRPAARTKPGIAVKDCKKGSGKLEGVQLELFVENVARNIPKLFRQTPADQPLCDLFPEAYDRPDA